MSLLSQEVLSRTYRPKIVPYVEGNYFEYAHYKRDGHFVRFEITVAGDGAVTWQAFTRRPTAVSWEIFRCWQGLQPMLDGIKATGVPGRWILLGEMFYPGKGASYVKTGLKNNDTSLRIEMFAVPGCPLDGWSIDESYLSGLPVVAGFCDRVGIPFAPYIEWSCDYWGIVRDLWNDVVGDGEDIEGFVLKNGHLTGWQKWKNELTIDLIISGYVEGEGKYAGSVGALRVETIEGVEVATVGTGLTDPMRHWINENRECCKGRIVEVQYQYVGAKGRLRHPVFVGFRDDKQYADCGVAQDPKLKLFWGKVKGL
jgi:hypothetical protein